MPKNPSISSQTRLLQEEVILLKKNLDGLVEENLSLKNRLSENLRKGFHGGLLETFEHIQNRLLQNDSLFKSMDRDGRDLEILLESNLSDDQFVHNVLRDKVFGLRARIHLGEGSLKRLKQEFDSYFN